MCEKAVEKTSHMLCHVPDHFKTQKMCDKVVRDDSFSLPCVPDWFVTQQQVKLWHDDNKDDDGLTDWYDDYKKLKVQKAQIKEELMPIAWHPSR